MNTSRSDLELISKFHRDCIRRWGIEDCRAVGYSNKSSQLSRFEVIAALYECGESVLDVGCGTGDLFAYLSRFSENLDYLGIEQQEEFVRNAETTYREYTNCKFQRGDFTSADLPQSDLVVACGSLSYRRENSQTYQISIERLFGAANKLFVFNMLDVARMFPGEVLIGHDPDAIARQCRAICDSVAVVRGYISYDFTIIMARGTTPALRLERLQRLPHVSTVRV